ncbi:MAG: low-complexity protein [Gammaproteobacteria bacterium]|nr:low-complexity protein [Gammaproteobacteria bacterium]
MSISTNKTTIALAASAALTAGLALSPMTVSADTNPFASTELSSGYMQLAEAEKANEGKCGEAKCGANKEGEKAKEGKCGEAKCGANKDGAKAADGEKAKEGKCGEAKCGADKK